ncbi:hypothetical protein QYE76_067467 [Lolium multiflorum]|uniref:Uncharacterized protein n=1 Tax=Lolium multiflorum TaxID=4521 RepID=A0AAD8SEJ8_LOLMU|nr:hypothetical protein QYE76_067467 [Lolium multiflorum]
MLACDWLICAADSKNAHLLALDGAEERLTLCHADLLNYDSLRAAFSGCHGVFHAASLRAPPVAHARTDSISIAVAS